MLVVLALTPLALQMPEPYPHATFTVTDKHLIVRLSHMENPLSGVIIRLFVGTQFQAVATSDADGQARFVRPSDSYCQVVCEFDAGSTAPIPLNLISADVVAPASFPLRVGVAACCQAPRRPQSHDWPHWLCRQWGYKSLIWLGIGAFSASIFDMFVRRSFHQKMCGNRKFPSNTGRMQ